MRHGEEPIVPPAIQPIPWRETVGLCYLSSGTEVVYAPEKYEEEEPRAVTITRDYEAV